MLSDAQATPNTPAGRWRTFEKSKMAEVRHSESRLQLLRPPVHQALAAVVINSAGFRALFAERAKAWAKLRTLYVVFGEVFRFLHGHMPEAERIRFQSHEPLEKHLRYFDGEKLTRYEWDEHLVSQWLQALTQLQTDADAPLPD